MSNIRGLKTRIYGEDLLAKLMTPSQISLCDKYLKALCGPVHKIDNDLLDIDLRILVPPVPDFEKECTTTVESKQTTPDQEHDQDGNRNRGQHGKLKRSMGMTSTTQRSITYAPS